MTVSFSSTAMKNLIKSIVPENAPVPFGNLQFGAEARSAFTVDITRQLRMSCHIDVVASAFVAVHSDEMHQDTKVKHCGIHAKLAVERFAHSEVEVYSAEWAERKGDVVIDNEIMRHLAFGVPCPSAEFPPEHRSSDDLKSYFDMKAEAIDWLLDRIHDDQVSMDQSRVWILVDGQLFNRPLKNSAGRNGFPRRGCMCGA